MAEHPILFSGEMVRAILAGKKTQTRRVIKPQPEEYRGMIRWQKTKTNAILTVPEGLIADNPYGQPGDLLWVRETHRLASINARTDSQFWTIQFKEGFNVLPYPQPKRELFEPIAAKDNFTTSNTGIDFGKWRPSIFMPRWASRITLRITDIRVERVQDISDYDCSCEGIALTSLDGSNYRNDFSALWDSINVKRGYSWESNPWVFVIEFERVK